MSYPVIGKHTLQEAWNLFPELMAAYDRDIPPDAPWATDENCECVHPHTGPVVFDLNKTHSRDFQVTDNHGLGFHWVLDPQDPLGGRWVRPQTYRTGFRRGSGTVVRHDNRQFWLSRYPKNIANWIGMTLSIYREDGVIFDYPITGVGDGMPSVLINLSLAYVAVDLGFTVNDPCPGWFDRGTVGT